MYPLIGITTYGRDQGKFAIPAEYVDAVRRAGGVSILFPPGETQYNRWLASIDGLVIAGGGDISPACYQGQSHDTNYLVDAERDRTDLEFVRALLDGPRALPTLAICRGMQVLNVVQGGTLHAHIPDIFGEMINHRLPPREPVEHELELEADSRLAAVLGQCRLSAMSWHHQSVDVVGKGLRIVGKAEDGVVEALEVEGRPEILAVQWHPELTAADDALQQKLFDNLVAQAKQADLGVSPASRERV